MQFREIHWSSNNEPRKKKHCWNYEVGSLGSQDTTRISPDSQSLHHPRRDSWPKALPRAPLPQLFAQRIPRRQKRMNKNTKNMSNIPLKDRPLPLYPRFLPRIYQDAREENENERKNISNNTQEDRPLPILFLVTNWHDILTHFDTRKLRSYQTLAGGVFRRRPKTYLISQIYFKEFLVSRAVKPLLNHCQSLPSWWWKLETIPRYQGESNHEVPKLFSSLSLTPQRQCWLGVEYGRHQ